MSKVVLQHCIGEQSALLDLTDSWHRRMCATLGYQFVTGTDKRCGEKTPYFEKIYAIIDQLKSLEDGSILVWLDADCIIRKPVDFESAMPKMSNLGMCLDSRSNESLTSWNGGVQIIRVCDAIREYYAEHYRLGPVTDSSFYRKSGDDGRTNQLLKSGMFPGVRHITVESKWNWSRVVKRPALHWPESRNYPVVEGFHCEALRVKTALIKDRLRMMGEKR